jgi:hypothetical protein
MALTNLYDWYVINIDFKTAIIAFTISFIIAVLVAKEGLIERKNEILGLVENGLILTIVIFLTDIFAFVNLATIFKGLIPHSLYGFHILFIAITIIVLKEYILAIIKNIVLEAEDKFKDVMFIIIFNYMYLVIAEKYLAVSIIATILFAMIMKLSGEANELIGKLIIMRYGLLYGEDEYKKAIKNVKVEQ